MVVWVLDLVDVLIINGNYVEVVNLILKKDVIYLELVNKLIKLYVNIIVIQEKNKDNVIYKKIVVVY